MDLPSRVWVSGSFIPPLLTGPRLSGVRFDSVAYANENA